MCVCVCVLNHNKNKTFTYFCKSCLGSEATCLIMRAAATNRLRTTPVSKFTASRSKLFPALFLEGRTLQMMTTMRTMRTSLPGDSATRGLGRQEPEKGADLSELLWLPGLPSNCPSTQHSLLGAVVSV